MMGTDPRSTANHEDSAISSDHSEHASYNNVRDYPDLGRRNSSLSHVGSLAHQNQSNEELRQKLAIAQEKLTKLITWKDGVAGQLSMAISHCEKLRVEKTAMERQFQESKNIIMTLQAEKQQLTESLELKTSENEELKGTIASLQQQADAVKQQHQTEKDNLESKLSKLESEHQSLLRDHFIIKDENVSLARVVAELQSHRKEDSFEHGGETQEMQTPSPTPSTHSQIPSSPILRSSSPQFMTPEQENVALKAQMNTLRTQYERYKKQFGTLSIELKRVKERYSAFMDEVARMKEAKLENERLKHELSITQNMLMAANEESANVVHRNQEQLVVLEETITKLSMKLSSIKTSVQEREDALSVTIKEYQDKIQTLENLNKEITTEIIQIRDQHGEATIKSSSLESELTELRTRMAEEIHSLKSSHGEEVINFERQIDILSSELAYLRSSHKEELEALVLSHKDELDTLNAKLSAISSELEEHRTRETDYQNELTQLHSQLASTTNELDSLRVVYDLETAKLNSEIVNLHSAFAEAQLEIPVMAEGSFSSSSSSDLDLMQKELAELHGLEAKMDAMKENDGVDATEQK